MWLSLIIRVYSEFSQTYSRYVLLLKMIPRYWKQDLFDKNMGTIKVSGGAWETVNSTFRGLINCAWKGAGDEDATNNL